MKPSGRYNDSDGGVSPSKIKIWNIDKSPRGTTETNGTLIRNPLNPEILVSKFQSVKSVQSVSEYIFRKTEVLVVSLTTKLCSFHYILRKLDSLFVVVDEEINLPLFMRRVKTRRLNLSSRWDFFYLFFLSPG